MALTATATKSTFDQVVDRLAMQKVTVVGTSPARDNTRYAVHPIVPMEEFCMSIAKDVRRQRIEYPKLFFSAESMGIAHLLSFES